MKVIFYAVMTLNGKIAHSRKEEVRWNSPEDRKFFFAEMRRHGVAIMGRATYDAVKQFRPGWMRIVLTRRMPKTKKNFVEFTARPLKEVLKDLEKRGFHSVAVVGGASVYSQFLEKGLVDEMMITVEPKIFGRSIAIFENMRKDFSLQLLNIRKLSSQTFVLHYKVIK
ncbi:MAG: dihydrofolate reductase [Parcubacteria group bacterium Gr01-1014_33]|nr:MAG: dihydrofolate reductase [Parcubacteria group bacterium Gr01-1014_33]